MSRPIYLIMGVPGSGKGTQGKQIAEKLGIYHLATGDLIKEVCRSDKNDNFCLTVKARFAAGTPQPDEDVLKIVDQKIASLEPGKGIIFDAFPLSMGQVEGLEKMLQKYDLSKPVVISLEITEQEALKRLSIRKTCPICHSAYGPFEDPYKANLCSKCNTELITREDDKPEIISKRYHEYIKRIEPMLTYYQEHGIILKIDGQREPQIIFDDIINQISQLN